MVPTAKTNIITIASFIKLLLYKKRICGLNVCNGNHLACERWTRSFLIAYWLKECQLLTEEKSSISTSLKGLKYYYFIRSLSRVNLRKFYIEKYSMNIDAFNINTIFATIDYVQRTKPISLIMSERSEWSSYYQSYTSHILDGIQTALKP